MAQRKDVIKLKELDEFMNIDGTLTALKTDLEIWQNKRDELEKRLIARIEAGANKSDAEKVYDISIAEILRRFPKWKIEFEKRCGIKAAEKILKSTPQISYKNLIIALKISAVKIVPVPSGRRKK